MREKELRLLLTFDTTEAAIALEAMCGRMGLPGRLIPVPRAITANCGMAWSAPKDSEADILSAAEQNGVRIAGVYYMIL